MPYQLVVTMPYYTGLARDVIINTWNFEYLDGTPGGAELDDLLTGMTGMYDGLYADLGVTPMGAPWINWSQVRWTLWDMSQPPPRVAIFDVVEPIAANSPIDSNFQLEAACVLSYRGAYAPGIARARQRGRVYLGGLTNQALTPGTDSSFVKFSDAWQTRVADFALDVVTLVNADWQWVVWSRANNATYPVVAGWVDAEIDHQRRRGNVNQADRLPWTAP